MVRTDQYVIYELDPTNGEYRLLTVTEHAGVATMYLTSGTPTSAGEINISA